MIVNVHFAFLGHLVHDLDGVPGLEPEDVVVPDDALVSLPDPVEKEQKSTCTVHL